jgi:putative addiction module component (TIGR02574 family)
MARRREDTVLNQALRLPLKQRARMAHELLVSLDEEPAEDPKKVAQAWDEEIARRVEQLRAGTVKTIPAATVFAQLKRQLRTSRAHRSRQK